MKSVTSITLILVGGVPGEDYFLFPVADAAFFYYTLYTSPERSPVTYNTCI